MNKSLDILDKNCSVETQSPLIYEKDIKTRKRIGHKSILFLVSLGEWNIYGVLKISEARCFRGKDLNCQCNNAVRYKSAMNLTRLEM